MIKWRHEKNVTFIWEEKTRKGRGACVCERGRCYGSPHLHVAVSIGSHGGSPCGSAVKNLPAMHKICRRCRFNPWVGKIPWRNKWQLAPVFLTWKILWREESGVLPTMGSQRVRHDSTTAATDVTQQCTGAQCMQYAGQPYGFNWWAAEGVVCGFKQNKGGTYTSVSWVITKPLQLLLLVSIYASKRKIKDALRNYCNI